MTKNIGECMKEKGKSRVNLQAFWNRSLKNIELLKNLYFSHTLGNKVCF